MAKRKAQTAPSLPNQFQATIQNIPDIQHCYQLGLQALGSNSSLVKPTDPRQLEGSVNLDTCVKRLYPDENRWDYMLSYRETLYFIEVHPAITTEVKTVLNKKAWLIKWLQNKAPQLQAHPPKLYWVASGGSNKILAHSPQARQAAKEGLLPIRELNLTP